MVKKILSGNRKLTRAGGKLFGTVGIVTLVAMMLLTVADVLLRYLFHRPILGGLEITQVMMVSISFVTMIYCTTQDSHVKVEIFRKFIPKRMQNIIDCIFYLAGMGLFLVMSWQNFETAIHYKKVHQVTDLLEIPLSHFYLLISISSAILVYLLLIYLLNILFRIEEK